MSTYNIVFYGELTKIPIIYQIHTFFVLLQVHVSACNKNTPLVGKQSFYCVNCNQVILGDPASLLVHQHFHKKTGSITCNICQGEFWPALPSDPQQASAAVKAAGANFLFKFLPDGTIQQHAVLHNKTILGDQYILIHSEQKDGKQVSYPPTIKSAVLQLNVQNGEQKTANKESGLEVKNKATKEPELEVTKTANKELGLDGTETVNKESELKVTDTANKESGLAVTKTANKELGLEVTKTANKESGLEVTKTANKELGLEVTKTANKESGLEVMKTANKESGLEVTKTANKELGLEVTKTANKEPRREVKKEPGLQVKAMTVTTDGHSVNGELNTTASTKVLDQLKNDEVQVTPIEYHKQTVTNSTNVKTPVSNQGNECFFFAFR